MLRAILLVMLAFLATQSYSQFYIGIQSGATLNYLQTNISDRPWEKYEPRFGYCGAIPVEIRWQIDSSRSVVGFASGIAFIQKSYALNRTDGLYVLNSHTRNDYMQVPISAEYRYSVRRVALIASGGLYGAYWAEGHISGAVPNFFNSAAAFPHPTYYNQEYAFNAVRDNRIEWGWQVGSGISLELPGSYEFNLRFDLCHALSNQQKNYMHGEIPRYNQTYALSIGIMKNLSNAQRKPRQEN